MALRLHLGLAALLLAACSSGGGTEGGAAEATSGAMTVPCALAGSRSFTARCGLERASMEGKVIVTLRHPNGGFRRLTELEGGKRYAAADGSDEVVIEANGAEIEITLGDDHYLLPVAAPAPASPDPDAAKR